MEALSAVNQLLTQAKVTQRLKAHIINDMSATAPERSEGVVGWRFGSDVTQEL